MYFSFSFSFFRKCMNLIFLKGRFRYRIFWRMIHIQKISSLQELSKLFFFVDLLKRGSCMHPFLRLLEQRIRSIYKLKWSTDKNACTLGNADLLLNFKKEYMHIMPVLNTSLKSYS